MTVTPYIIFNGNCEEALNFYASALGGNVQFSRYSDAPGAASPSAGNKILHAVLNAEGLALMASDDGREDSASAPGPDKVHLSLDFKDSGQQQTVFDTLSQEGTITMPLQDTFWGARFGMLTDKYGVNWMFNYDQPKG